MLHVLSSPIYRFFYYFSAKLQESLQADHGPLRVIFVYVLMYVRAYIHILLDHKSTFVGTRIRTCLKKVH